MSDEHLSTGRDQQRQTVDPEASPDAIEPKAPPAYRRPSTGPSGEALGNLIRWQTLQEGSAAQSTKTAETWRNGLAGFVTLLTSVLIFKGADIADVAEPQKYGVSVLIAAGALAAIRGLWLALAAEAPPMADVEYCATISEHKTIAAYEQQVQRESASKLSKARRWIFVSLLAIFAGTITWWLSPAADKPKSSIQVTWSDQDGAKQTVCGTQTAASSGKIAILVGDAEVPTIIQLSSVVAIKIVSKC